MSGSALKRLVRSAAVLAFVAAIVACAAAPPKSAEQRQADADLVGRVQGALNADQELFSKHITIRADDGVVYLGGYVWTQPEMEDAIHIAEDVAGVHKVVNSMEVDRGGLSDSSVTR